MGAVEEEEVLVGEVESSVVLLVVGESVAEVSCGCLCQLGELLPFLSLSR